MLISELIGELHKHNPESEVVVNGVYGYRVVRNVEEINVISQTEESKVEHGHDYAGCYEEGQGKKVVVIE